MLDKAIDTIRKYGMLKKGDIVCVAVSGGVDSTVLLHLLNRLKGEFSIDLIVCHLNHNLRGKESERDYLFVKRLAEGMGLPFEGKKLFVKEVKSRRGESLQQWARGKRLKFLKDAAKKHRAKKIALGHNLNDQAETVLMRLIKGSGTSGLAGMAPVREAFIRPLIETPREDIERYAIKSNLKYAVDSTNRTLKYLRNRVRLELIPFIEKQYNPNIIETLARTAAVLRKDADCLEKEAEKIFPRVVTRTEKRRISMDRERLLALHPAVLTRGFLKAAGTIKNGISEVYTPQIQNFVFALAGKKPNIALELRHGLYLERRYGVIVLSAEKPKTGVLEGFEKEVKVPGVTRVEELNCALKAEVLAGKKALLPEEGSKNTAYFDYRKITGPLKIRTFRAGDRLQPLGMKGRHKKLKDIFIDEKIHAEKRGKILIVTAGEDIIWVTGLRQSEVFRVDDKSRKILKLEIVENIA